MNLKGHSLDELTSALAAIPGANASPLVARKVFAAVFSRGAERVADVALLPQVPRGVARWLESTAQLPSLQVVERRRADDGFVKYLFESPLGGRFEAVRIPLFDTKYVVCISSQVGCALACDFCETGRLGFGRNLTSWEILDQVMRVRAEADRPVRGVVFMGMGEPFLNYNDVLRAAEVLRHPAGLAISGKAITLSTAGHVPGIRRFVREGHPYRLAFSITSAIPEKRAQVMPVERTYPLPELVEAIRAYSETRNERAMLAYVMIRGFNTGAEDARALAETFRDIPIKVDLIDVTDPTGKYLPPTPEELASFRDYLQILKAPVARRYSGGKEIGAACGTLAASQRGGVVLEWSRSSTP